MPEAIAAGPPKKRRRSKRWFDPARAFLSPSSFLTRDTRCHGPAATLVRVEVG
jgi:hypothetical protein